MSTSSTPQSPPLVIKGSWEDLLAQAHRAAASQNDEAIALYEKVVHGLRRLPATQRRAQNNRLQELLKLAAANLHVYLTQRNRYEEALALLPLLQETAEGDEHKAWGQRAAMVYDLAGRGAEAVAQLYTLATDEDAKLTDWGNLVTYFIRTRQFDEAEHTIEEALQWSTREQEVGRTTYGSAAADAAYLENLRSLVALAQGHWEEGIEHYTRAAALDQDYKDQPHLLYARLMVYGQPELALRFIQRDSKHPLRASFWYGVALKRLGREDEARRQWEQSIKTLSPKTDNAQFVELVLTFFYLGDREGRGLNAVLQTLQSGGAKSWLLLFLAGLGWALRGNLNSARTNFALAVTRRKAGAEGAKLSVEVWQYCQDLLSEEVQAQLVDYFETEK